MGAKQQVVIPRQMLINAPSHHLLVLTGFMRKYVTRKKTQAYAPIPINVILSVETWSSGMVSGLGLPCFKYISEPIHSTISRAYQARLMKQ